MKLNSIPLITNKLALPTFHHLMLVVDMQQQKFRISVNRKFIYHLLPDIVVFVIHDILVLGSCLVELQVQ